jgi:hypothetical protein
MPVHSQRRRYTPDGSPDVGRYTLVHSNGEIEEGQFWLNNLFGSHGFNGLYGTITDHKTSRDAVSGDLPQSEVRHFKMWGAGLGTVGIFTSSMFGNPNWWQALQLVFNYDLYTSSYVDGDKDWSVWIKEADGDDLRKASRRAFASINTQFPEEISILNFIWELREMPGMLMSLFTRGTALRTQFPHAVNLGDVAKDYLAWSFGWEPFLVDMLSIFNIMFTVNDRLEHLKRTKGKAVKAGYSQVLEDFRGEEECGWSTNVPSPNNFANIQSLCTRRVRKFRAGARVRNNLDFLDEFQGQLRGYLGALGLTNPAKVVWNALPFSFIVDWFGDVSGFLSAFLTLQHAADWEVDRVSSSVTTEAKYSFRVTTSAGFVLQNRIGNQMARLYQRWKGFPVDPLEIAILSPTPKQLSLLAALVHGSNRY